MKILITGCNGQLGTELSKTLSIGKSELGTIPACYNDAAVTCVDIHELDISDINAVQAFFSAQDFDVIINCAAMTDVDTCESDLVSAMKGNAIGPHNLALAASQYGCKLVHVSTDYVFSGDADKPHCEWDIPAPNTAYGKSKLLGEQYVRQACARAFIVRTAWLYGYAGNNFVKTIIRLAKERESIKVVDDQRGNPTNVSDLTHHILKIAATECYGLYHCTGDGECSWYDFACEIVRLFGAACDVLPCTTSEYPRPTPRPAYSALNNLALRCTVGDNMRYWKDALACFINHVEI